MNHLGIIFRFRLLAFAAVVSIVALKRSYLQLTEKQIICSKICTYLKRKVRNFKKLK